MKINEFNGKLVCSLDGHYDTLQSQKLEAALKDQLKGAQSVEFEMQQVTYVCSAFLRVCIIVVKTVGAGHFKLTGMTPPIMRIFKMAGMLELLGCE